MKYILILLASFFMMSCSSSKMGQNKIAYLFPIQTEDVINDFLEKNRTVDYVIYLLTNSDGVSSTLYFLELDEDDDVLNRCAQGNRYVYVDGEYIPIVFDYDYKFSTEVIDNKPQIIMIDEKTEMERKEDIPSLEFRRKNVHLIGYPRTDRIIDLGYYIIIDNNGKIIEKSLGSVSNTEE